MNMRPKTKRRLVILVSASFLTVSSLGGLYFFRQHQIEGQVLAARAAGLQAYEAGDYPTALKYLSKFNEKRQRDPVTLFAFAKARSRVETPNYRHLAEAIAFYRRGLELQPKDATPEQKKVYDEARHALLELYTNPYVAYNAEAVALANQLLDVKDASKDDSPEADLGTAKDIAAIRAKAKALYRLRKLEGALAASKKLNELAPLDVEGQRLTYELMYQLKKPGNEILARAQEARKANPKDPRFQMLEGYACMLTGRTDDATALLLAAGGLDKDLSKKMTGPSVDDPKFVNELAGMLDAMRMYDHTNKLLELSAAKSNDPEMQRMLVQRLWQSGKFPEVADRLAALTLETGNSRLLAYRAMCLFQLNQADKARPIVDALAGRKDDDVALAWAKALRTRFDAPALSAGQQITEYQAALGRDPYNPVIRYMMGESYARLGETEPALQNWRMVADAEPSWATPRTQIARLLTESGRPQLAAEEAQKAYNRAHNLGSAIGLAVAYAGTLDNSMPRQQLEDVLSIVAEIQAKVPNEPETLPIYAVLLARSGQQDKAAGIIRGTASSDLALPEATLLRLASASRALGVGAEAALFDKSQKLHGLTPSLAMARAISAATPAKGDDAAAIAAKRGAALADLRKQADAATRDTADWKLMVARFMQATNDPGAPGNWVKLGDANPNELNIQAAIVDLPEDSAVWQDRAFVDKSIQRLRAITGDEGHRWQLARARWLLKSDRPDRDSAEAVVLLTDLVRSSPGMVAPRVYLARALTNVKQVPQAIEHLKAAAAIDTTSPVILMELARLLQEDGRFEEAAQYLDRLARSETLDPEQRARAAAMMARGGDAGEAIKVLQTGAANGDASRALLLAALHRRRGEFEAAGKIYDELLKKPDADANTIVDAADFRAVRGDAAGARQILARLDKADLPAEQRALMLADFEERNNPDPKAALGLLQQATQANPASVEAWTQLAAYQTRKGDYAQAVAAADQGLKLAGQNEKLAALKAVVAKLQQLDRQDLQPLASALSQAPSDKAAIDTLSQLLELKQNNDNPDQAATKLTVNADRYPRFMPAQKLATGALLRLKRYDEATKVANRCVNVFPNDPDAPEMAVAVHTSAGRWSDMLAAAEEWRARSGDHPMRPDLAIAEARMQMAQPARAIEQLRPYLDGAKQDPAAGQLVIAAYSRALLLDGNDAEAKALLTPLLTSREWRSAWIRLSGFVRGSDTARDWLAEVARVIPQDAFDEHQALARAWYALGTRYGYTDGYVRARKLAETLVQTPKANAGTFLILAAACEKTSDPANAIAAYRKALALEPNLSMAQNNLAYQLLMTGQNLDEARQLAEKAVAAESGEASYQDTLARILTRTGDRPRAIKTFQSALQLEPNNIETNLGLAETFLADGNVDAATQVADRVDALLRANPTAPVSYRQDLKNLRDRLASK